MQGKPTKITSRAGYKTLNKAGDKAINLESKTKLMTMVTTSFFNEKKYYGDNSQEIIDLATKLAKSEPDFISKLAVYTRKELNLRTISQVLSSILAKHGSQYSRATVFNVVQRPDDMANILSYYIESNKVSDKRPSIPKGLKKGLSDAFGLFNEYSLSKYKGKGQSVSLKDVFCIAHPPADQGTERYSLYNRLLNNTMKTPDTWEVELSKSTNKKTSWERLIKEKKLGYMALLRNLRNIEEAGVNTECKKLVIDFLTSEKAVLNSKQLPFRFLSAYKTVQNIDFKVAIEKAMEISVDNLPEMTGITFIMTDNSGSMTHRLSERSEMSYMEIGHILSAMLYKKNPKGTIIGVFGQDFKIYKPLKEQGTNDIARSLKQMSVGHSTNAHKGLDYLARMDTKVDRVIILSDMQVYGPDSVWSGDPKISSQMKNYRDAMGETYLHSIDLTGYGTTQFRNDCNMISGWSDKILKFITMVEDGGRSMIEEIEEYNIEQ